MATQSNANFTIDKKNFMLNAWIGQTITIRFLDDTSSPANVGSTTLSFASASNGQVVTNTQPAVTIAAGKVVSRAQIIVGLEVHEEFTFEDISLPNGGDIIVSEFISSIGDPS